MFLELCDVVSAYAMDAAWLKGDFYLWVRIVIFIGDIEWCHIYTRQNGLYKINLFIKPSNQGIFESTQNFEETVPIVFAGYKSIFFWQELQESHNEHHGASFHYKRCNHGRNVGPHITQQDLAYFDNAECKTISLNCLSRWHQIYEVRPSRRLTILITSASVKFSCLVCRLKQDAQESHTVTKVFFPCYTFFNSFWQMESVFCLRTINGKSADAMYGGILNLNWINRQ